MEQTPYLFSSSDFETPISNSDSTINDPYTEDILLQAKRRLELTNNDISLAKNRLKTAQENFKLVQRYTEYVEQQFNNITCELWSQEYLDNSLKNQYDQLTEQLVTLFKELTELKELEMNESFQTYNANSSKHHNSSFQSIDITIIKGNQTPQEPNSPLSTSNTSYFHSSDSLSISESPSTSIISLPLTTENNEPNPHYSITAPLLYPELLSLESTLRLERSGEEIPLINSDKELPEKTECDNGEPDDLTQVNSSTKHEPNISSESETIIEQFPTRDLTGSLSNNDYDINCDEKSNIQGDEVATTTTPKTYNLIELIPAPSEDTSSSPTMRKNSLSLETITSPSQPSIELLNINTSSPNSKISTLQENHLKDPKAQLCSDKSTDTSSKIELDKSILTPSLSIDVLEKPMNLENIQATVVKFIQPEVNNDHISTNETSITLEKSVNSERAPTIIEGTGSLENNLKESTKLSTEEKDVEEKLDQSSPTDQSNETTSNIIDANTAAKTETIGLGHDVELITETEFKNSSIIAPHTLQTTTEHNDTATEPDTTNIHQDNLKLPKYLPFTPSKELHVTLFLEGVKKQPFSLIRDQLRKYKFTTKKLLHMSFLELGIFKVTMLKTDVRSFTTLLTRAQELNWTIIRAQSG